MTRRACRHVSSTCSALLAAAIVLAAGPARATNVTEVPENGSEPMGRGGAWLARASDPLAVTFNAAGLAGQPTRLTLQSNLLVHRTCFTRLRAAGDASADPLADAGGRFPRVCSDVEPALNPQLGGTLRITDRLGVGLLVAGPASSGVRTFPEFVEDGTGQRRAAPQRYLLTRQSGTVVFPTIGVGWEVLPGVRLGASFGWGIAKLKSTAATFGLNGAGLSPDNDVRANLQVLDAFVPRVVLGGLWSVTSAFDLAGWFQWTDAIRARGDLGTASSYYTAANARGDASRVAYADTYFSDCGTGRASDAGKCSGGDKASLLLPQPMEAKLGLRYHRVREGASPASGDPTARRRRSAPVRDPLARDLFDVEVDLTWANNSAIDALQVRFPGDAAGAGKLPVAGIAAEIPPNADQMRNFRDVLGVRVGGDVAVIPDRLALRAGAYVESSAARAQYQHLDFAATARLGLALGATYRIRLENRGAIELMAGWGHTFFADSAREDPAAPGISALAGTSCTGAARPTSPGTCSDGGARYRTRAPVNLGTITNAMNVVNVGVAYVF